MLHLARCGRTPFVCRGMAIAALLVTSATGRFQAEDGAGLPDQTDPVNAAIATLLSGDPANRLQVAEDADDLFVRLCQPALFGDQFDHAATILGLKHFLRTEPDEWIARTLLQQLSEIKEVCEALVPLVEAALTDPSPNLKRAALEWARMRPVPGIEPVLESLLRHPPPDWVLPSLLAAVAARAPGKYTDALLPFVDHPSPMVWEQAIETLGESRDDRALARLAELGRHGDRQRRIAALEALAEWDDSDVALRVVLEGSRSDDLDVRHAAIASLRSFSAAPAVDRLLAIVRDHADPARGTALAGLRHNRSGSEVADAVMQVLREPATEEGAYLRAEALRVLHNLDEPSVLPDLSKVVGGSETEAREIRELVEYLGRDRETKSRSFVISTSCSRGYVDPDDPGALRVAPPRGMRTIRCWERPGVAWEGADEQRLPAGHLVEVEDHFDLDGALWVMLQGLGFDECWVPRWLLEENEGRPTLSRKEIFVLRRQEFDLPTKVLGDPSVQALIDSGLLIVFDPSPAVQGVALLADTEGPLPAALARASAASSRPLDPEILAEVLELLCEYQEELCDDESTGTAHDGEAETEVDALDGDDENEEPE